jgi:hypothetical protein
MTVRARREEEKVSVSVNFTDPQLRALAESNADRLQEALREQYDSQVDLSLTSDGAGESNGGREDSRGSRGTAPAKASTSSEAAAPRDRARAARAALAGARNEWIG